MDDDWWLGSGIYVNKADQAEDGASSFSEPAASKEELASFVEAAASYARVFGRDIATKDFMDLEGPFVRGDVYIFAYEFNGTSLLSLAFPPRSAQTVLTFRTQKGSTSTGG